MAGFRPSSFRVLFNSAAVTAALEASKASVNVLRQRGVFFSAALSVGNSAPGTGRWNRLATAGGNHNKGGGSRSQYKNFLLCSLSVGGAAGVLGLLGPGRTNMVAAEATSAPTEEGGTENDGTSLPDLQTEFMVNMTCEGCVKAVRSKLEPLEGVRRLDVDLENQVVRVFGSVPVKNLITAVESTGRDVRLIGQGVPSEFTVSAAVAEFKGPQVHGVVRFAQVSMEASRIEAFFSGLTPGKHAWSINMYGDLTRGAASTGGVYEIEPSSTAAASTAEPMGNLGTLEADMDGNAEFNGKKLGLQVHDLIGRAVVVYEDEDKSKDATTASVIARSAGVGQNYKKICSCDGTIIWESSNSDFAKL
ncbi:hypothetical protein R1sor_021291 [Riccia sorocarpa]|uniref:Superoxide dismutase copper chaperone n=1 Tax=Riccia sorocarpa TaxID=122646 RepID=A0ABD3GJT8_9MARC